MDMRKKKKTFKLLSLVLIISICTAMTGCTDILSAYLPQQSSITIDDVPEYDGQPYVIINGNVPSFTDEEYEQDTFEYYNSLDYLGRCTYAYANIGEELMPTEPRGSIGQVKPTGWHLVKYDFIDGKYLYNRCHLIGYQLTGENANENNLITGMLKITLDRRPDAAPVVFHRHSVKLLKDAKIKVEKEEFEALKGIE